MQFDATRLFCEVAQQRSVSRAAEIRGITQSAASQRIQALEKELGVTLVDRSTRPLTLTEAGEVYYRGGKRLLESFERLKQRAAMTATGGRDCLASASLRGVVSVSSIYSAGIDLLNQVKTAFEQEFSRVSVSILYHRPDEVFDAVRQGQCDIGILSYPQKWSGLCVTPLRVENMVAVVRPGHPLSGRYEMSAGELDGLDMVGFVASLPIGRHLRQFVKEHCGHPHMINEFDNIDTMKTFIAQSEVLAILPARTVQREVARGMLSTIALDPTPQRPLGIVYQKQRRQKPLVKTFVDYLLKNQPAPATTTPAFVSA